MSRRFHALVLLLLAAAAAALVWLSSPWGLATTPDSIHYLREARKLVHGAGLFELSTRTPPLYPLMLALGARLAGDILDGARLLNPLLFAVNVLLFAAAARREGISGRLCTLLAALVFALSPAVYEIHVHVLSEGPFITCLLLGICALRRHVDGDGARWLAVAACAFGLATLARFSGIAFVGAGVLLVLLQSQARWPARMLAALRFAALALWLPLAWLAGSMLLGPGGAPRSTAMHLIGSEHLLMGWQTLLEFCGRKAVGDIGAGALLLVVSALLARAALVAGSDDPARRFVRAGLVLIGVYAAFLLVSISLADFYTPLDRRILLPAWIVVLLLLPAAVAAGGKPALPPLARAVTGGLPVACCLLVLLASGLPALRVHVDAGMRDGIGYFGRKVRTMPMLGYLAATRLPAMASNAPEILEIYFGRDATLLPAYIERVQNRLRPEYEAEMDRLVADVAAGRGVIVWFSAFRWRDHLPGREVFDESLHLPVLYRGQDGVIYGVRPAR